MRERRPTLDPGGESSFGLAYAHFPANSILKCVLSCFSLQVDPGRSG